jgi:hypothetical protein
MKTTTQTLAAALRQLTGDIDSPDGVPNAAILEAAERLEELAEQVELLTAQLVIIDKIHSDLTNAEMVVEGCDHIGGLITNQQIDEIGNALNYPEDCLREIQAESRKAGFMMGCEYAGDGFCSDADLINYANLIRKGTKP